MDKTATPRFAASIPTNYRGDPLIQTAPRATADLTSAVPKVSIGMPVYNGALFIRDALDSLLLQTFTDFELIISDNASTDATGAICREYAADDSRIRYVRQPATQRAVENFLVVLDKAVGTYFMWAAADDYCRDNSYLANLVLAMGGETSLAFPDVDIVDDAGQVMRRSVLVEFKKCSSVADFALAAVKISSYQLYGLFKLEVLHNDLKYIRKHAHLACYSEGLFVQAVLSTRRVVFVSSAVKCYRRHSQNASSIVKATKLLPAFFTYHLDCTIFFLRHKSLPVLLKLKIIAIKQILGLRYMSYLLLAAIWQESLLARKILEPIRNLNL